MSNKIYSIVENNLFSEIFISGYKEVPEKCLENLRGNAILEDFPREDSIMIVLFTDEDKCVIELSEETLEEYGYRKVQDFFNEGSPGT